MSDKDMTEVSVPDTQAEKRASFQDCLANEDTWSFGKTQTCPICQKDFYCYSRHWMYKRRNRHGFTEYFCGYNCYRVWDKAVREKHLQQAKYQGLSENKKRL